jgi:hypothetical protein
VSRHALGCTLSSSVKCARSPAAGLTSSLITIVDTGRSRVVQFSHFSVKVFLTSTHLATLSQDASRYHIVLEPAHTVLAQACMSILLQLHDHDAPLAKYAAEYWVRHAQFEDVVSCIKGMESVFDLDKPYFAAWHRLHDIDSGPHDTVFNEVASSKSGPPLYYAAMCGFSNHVEQLIVKYLQHVNAIGGYYGTPAVAALAGRHFKLAQVLHHNSSSLEPRGGSGWSPLHCAAYYGNTEMIQVLLDCRVDVNAQTNWGSTSLLMASWENFDDHDHRVVRLLLDHGADPNIQPKDGGTPLHRASLDGKIEMACLLVEHGASVELQDGGGKSPLDLASERQHDEIVKLLLEHRAK